MAKLFYIFAIVFASMLFVSCENDEPKRDNEPESDGVELPEIQTGGTIEGWGQDGE